MNAGKTKILVLGGTAEGIKITEAITNAKNFGNKTEIIYSLAGRTKNIPNVSAKIRVGGFSSENTNSVDGLTKFLTGEKIDLVIDATHPFAEQISINAMKAANNANIPALRIERQPWQMPEGADILYVPDMVEAAKVVARTARRVLLTVGTKELDSFTGIPKVHFVVRMIEKPDTPDAMPQLDNFEIITGRPPFNLADEETLMRDMDIDVLLSKASGGDATFAKIQAAANVGLRIILIRRPPPPDGDAVWGVEPALKWLEEKI